MILFVPSYDAATGANLAVARALPADGVRALLCEEATRDALLGALQEAERPLFAMAHGRPQFLRGQDGQVALDGKDLAALGARPVYAFACHTATRLGEQAAQSGAIWWGYTGAIQCPEDAAALLPIFVRIFSYIREAFPGARDRAERERVLLRIAELCREAEQEVDELTLADATLDVSAAYYCLLHIWDRLRVWAQELDAPQQHPQAQPPSLFHSPLE